MPEKKVGISNIYVRNPHIRISSEELAKAISAKDFIAEIEAIAREEQRVISEKIKEREELAAISYPYGPIEDFLGPNHSGETLEDLIVLSKKLEEFMEELSSATDIDTAIKLSAFLVEKGVTTEQSIRKIAESVQVSPQKISEGLGINSITLPSFAESNATFVADMLYDFAVDISSSDDKLAKLRDKPLKTIFYSSESNPDRSRPELEIALELVYSRLLEEDPEKYREVISALRHAMLFPTTYACVGGVMSLDQAARSIRGNESALVISADTAIYDPKLAPHAETTQGAGAVLYWITTDPEIAVIDYEGRGAYHLSLADFTKYLQEHPVVYGKFSEIIYVYMVSKAMAASKVGMMPLSMLKFIVEHVPFPKQALYLASFLFVHELRNFDKAKFEEIQSRSSVGKEPLAGFSSLTDLLDSKFKKFNGERNMEEQEFIKYIENDKDIKNYWAWLANIRKQPEFEKFKKDLMIDKALVLPSNTGNVYSSASLQSFASLLNELAKDPGILSEEKIKLNGVMGGYGSGAQAVAMPIEIETTKEKLIRNISIKSSTLPINADQYIQLHKWLIAGSESERSSNSGNLFKKSLELLRRETIPDGFYIIKRNIDGTGEYCYVSNGVERKLKIRY
ncbi:MAG: hypothetical protein ACP5TL_03210 [Candidatus Micrarchaeia archaeon]